MATTKITDLARYHAYQLGVDLTQQMAEEALQTCWLAAESYKDGVLRQILRCYVESRPMFFLWEPSTRTVVTVYSVKYARRVLAAWRQQCSSK